MKFRQFQLSTRQPEFVFVLGYRWASLLPVLWLLFTGQYQETNQFASGGLVFGVAFGITLIITLFHKKLNAIAIKQPLVMVVDLMLAIVILMGSGGLNSPYYLYALSPLLASAFFFQIRGALISSLIFTPIYLLTINSYTPVNLPSLGSGDSFTKLVGIWLMPLLIGYLSSIMGRLQNTQYDNEMQNEKLARSHKQLKIIHDLATLIQAAPDIQSVSQTVLGGITSGLGYSRAATVLVDPVSEHLGNWSVHPPMDIPAMGLPALPLNPHDGPLLKSLYHGKPSWLDAESKFTSNQLVNDWLQQASWIIIPLTMQNHMVGILLVESDEGLESISENELTVLNSVAKQVAVSLGTTLLCIDRARNLAIEQERNRIAREIHDTVSQSLFGMVYSLDASIDHLPNNPESVRDELIELRELASSTRDEIRHSILDTWPSQLTMEGFKSDLRSYTNHCCKPNKFDINFHMEGEIVQLPSGIRRSLYRMAQEALSNASRHSGAAGADVCLNVSDDNICLSILDDGRGFETDLVLSREYNRESFGLHGIKERVSAIGGNLDIFSKPGHGTRILIDINLSDG